MMECERMILGSCLHEGFQRMSGYLFHGERRVFDEGEKNGFSLVISWLPLECQKSNYVC